MARPPLDVGTYGKVRTYEQSNGTWLAVANYRDTTGETKPVKRFAETEGKAERRLKKALTERGRRGSGSMSGDTCFDLLAPLWLAEVRRVHRDTTGDRYEGRLKRVVTRFGRLRLREISPGMVDDWYRELERSGLQADTVRSYRSVLSGVLDMAVRRDLIETNPCRGAGVIRGGGKPSRALRSAERTDLLDKVDADQRAVADDLPDLLRYFMGMGTRLGETIGLRWFRVDLDEGVVVHGDNLVQVTGKGLVLHEPKTLAGFRVLPLPDFVWTMLRVRYPGERSAQAPVFPSQSGGWRNPNNTGRSVRLFRKNAGYPWFTTHACRHTAAKILDEQRLTPRMISGYLGHANPAFTQRRYMDAALQDRAAAVAIDAAMRRGR